MTTTTMTVNNNRTYRFTVASPEGQPLFTVLITRERTEIPKPVPASVSPAPAPARPVNGPTTSNDGDARMTEPQKRYLFRLLAQQGVDGKAAEAHLKQFFRVNTLREVSKTAASHLIERMVADQKEVGHGNA
jgi:hypothetical protein